MVCIEEREILTGPPVAIGGLLFPIRSFLYGDNSPGNQLLKKYYPDESRRACEQNRHAVSLENTPVRRYAFFHRQLAEGG